MKRVIYIRHAKSSWADIGIVDKNRKLNDRGNRDAPIMASILGEILNKKNINVNEILCSSSKRTSLTIDYFLKNGFENIPVRYEDKLYHASLNDLIEQAYGTDENYSTIIICAHNPGLTYLAYEVGIDTDNIPTCGIFECIYNCEKWNQISLENAKPGFYIYPKLF